MPRVRAITNFPTIKRDGRVFAVYMHSMNDVSALPTISSIREDFAFLDDWEDRYRYLIDLGRDLPSFPEDARTDANKVQGCVSQVWIVTEREDGPDPVMRFQGDSDAHIVRGLVAIILALFSGKRASEVETTDAESILREFGLDEHLTPQRANGLRSMIARIKREAAAASGS